MRAFALVLLIGILATGQGHADTEPGPGDANRGAELARAHCGRCHGLGRTGESPNPQAPPFRELARRYPLENLEEALAEGISVGHEGVEMPEFQFAPEQIDDLLAFIRGLSE